MVNGVTVTQVVTSKRISAGFVKYHEYERDRVILEQKMELAKMRAIIKNNNVNMAKKDATITRLKTKLSKMGEKVKAHNERIIDQNEKLRKKDKEIQAMTRKIKKLTKQNAEQDRRLDVHENAHVPSSKAGPLNGEKKNGGNTKSAGKKCKRGGVRRHVGGTRILIPNRTVKHKSDRCINCDGTNIKTKGRPKRRTIVTIPEPIPCDIALHFIHKYLCGDCGAEFETETNLPKEGKYDYPVLCLIVYLYHHRMTDKAISEVLHDMYRIELTPQAVSNLLRRGTHHLEKERDRNIKIVENSPVIIPDETIYPGEPGKYWPLICRTINTVVFFNATSRSAKKLISQLKGCKGIVVRDGYKGYDTVFPNHTKQRCTVHLEREAKNTAERTESPAAAVLYGEIAGKYKKLRVWTLGNHSWKSRIRRVDKEQAWLRQIISRYRKSSNKKLKKFATKLENAADQMLTFVLYPEAPSNTNLAEQSVRKVIGHRNNRIQIKSQSGADTLCTILTCTETWKLRKQNVWEQLLKHIAPGNNK